MVNDSEYDAIVVGAGVAGIACAGELLLQGLRPLLICETKEVAYNLRSEWIGNNRLVIQAPTIQLMWGDSSWVPMARALNAQVGPLTTQTPFQVAFWGSKEVHSLKHIHLTAASMTEALAPLSPIPLDDHRAELNRVLTAALAIPYQELLEMQDVLLVEWLAEQGASDFVSGLIMLIVSLLHIAPRQAVREQVTMFGSFGFLRSGFNGECFFPEAYPDIREGVWIPIAQAIEQNGGTVRRGQKVARVLTEGDRAVGVLLDDGTEFRAPVVAIATGNPRIPKLLDPPPPEVEKITSLEWGEHRQIALFNFTLLHREVLPRDFEHFFGVISTDPEFYQWMWPGHGRAPWGTEPGKQTLVSFTVLTTDKIDEMGGREAVYQRIREVERFYFPAMSDAIEQVKTTERIGGMWFSQALAGAKLQRRSESVDGLWYVGDGSRPVAGVWTEAAASAGTLGARAIAEAHRKTGER